jgi:hypothetical protein
MAALLGVYVYNYDGFGHGEFSRLSNGGNREPNIRTA